MQTQVRGSRAREEERERDREEDRERKKLPGVLDPKPQNTWEHRSKWARKIGKGSKTWAAEEQGLTV